MSGFRFSETMQGTWKRGDEERAIRFTIDARVQSALQFVSDRRATIDGHAEVNGLARHALLTGSMLVDPLIRRVITYDFHFRGDDGKTYRLSGKKDVSPLRPVRSMTSLPASITDEQGQEVGTAELHFDLRDLLGLVASFRLHL